MENFIKIKIGKKEYGFKFTMITLEKLSEKIGQAEGRKIEYNELFDYLQGEPFGTLRRICVCSNKVYNEGKEMTEYQMDELIDQMSGEQITQIRDSFSSSLVRMMEKFKSFGDEAKKK